MGWFNKEKKQEAMPSLPELPKLPSLPELPKINQGAKEPFYQLPSFPSNSIGDKFSQNTIKEAVTGKKEDKEEFDADDFADSRMQKMHAPLDEDDDEEETIPVERKIRTKEYENIPEGFEDAARKVKGAEPVFIRLDKFEDSLNTFKKTKAKLLEIERILNHTKRIKEEEARELETWEAELQTIKKQIEKIDKDIFSKV